MKYGNYNTQGTDRCWVEGLLEQFGFETIQRKLKELKVLTAIQLWVTAAVLIQLLNNTKDGSTTFTCVF